MIGAGAFAIAFGLFAPPAQPQPAAADACVICHSDPDMVDAPAHEIPGRYREDVHAGAGLSCADCHGGDPDPALSDDLDASMDDSLAKNPYRGAPNRKEVPGFCARCHSDPAYMKRFRPDARVDQEHEYRTSRHGIALARGDTKVAVCTDCHGVHGILPAGDRRSPVHPSRVAETCRRCHEDAKLMAGRLGDDGKPLPVDQYARWRASVHATALLDKEDLSAPTCNDCHGNHGAAPPGLDSVAFVCGRCHGREAELFRASPKHAAFHASGDADEQCIACHRNHDVLRPTIAMLSPLPDTPCAFCHEGPLGEESDEAAREHYREVRDSLLADAADDGAGGLVLFDRLVDRALSLPWHSSGDRLRPEFERLFKKFRIGKTSYEHLDPSTGVLVREDVVRCADCHDGDDGARVAAEMIDRMRDLTARTARAERILLTARRGGVEIRQVMLDVDAAIDAQIDLEVLVHGFSTDSAGGFAEAQRRGVAAASRAETHGGDALAELGFRRTGLAVSLVLIALVLCALALKIRSLPSESPG